MVTLPSPVLEFLLENNLIYPAWKGRIIIERMIMDKKKQKQKENAWHLRAKANKGSSVPSNIIYIPCIILMSIISIKTANYRFKHRFLKSKNIGIIMGNSKKMIFTLILFCVVAMFIEAFVCPSLIKIIV